MSTHLRLLSYLLPLTLFLPSTLCAVELTRGAMLANSCAACHGTDGYSPGSIPSIGGRPVIVIESALRDFRDGRRQGTVMSRHATGYTDEEIRLIAEFFAARKPQ